MNEDYVMYCIFSKEAIKAMGGNRGKMASMAGHAFLHAWWDAVEYEHIPFPSRGFGAPQDQQIRDEQRRWMTGYQKFQHASRYKDSGFAKKVTLVVETTDELNALYEKLKDLPYGSTLVVDRGLTVFEGPTTVCVGFGPVEKEHVPDALKSLKVLI